MTKAITYRHNKKNNCGTLTLKESLTVENIENVKNSLQDALAKDGSLIINHSGAEDFDLSYLQLLASTIKTAEAQKKTVSIIECDSEEFKNLLEDSGFSNLNYLSSNSRILNENKRKEQCPK